MDAIHEQRKQILTERGWAFQIYNAGGRWDTDNHTVYKDGKKVLSVIGYNNEEAAIDAAWTADTPNRRLATIKAQEAKIAELLARVAELEQANARLFSTITAQAKAIEAHHDALRFAHWGLKTQESSHAE